MQIELPANARRADGDLAWQGDLAAGQSISVSATVVFDAGGDTTVLCRTLRQIDAKNSWGDLAALYLSVGETATQEGFAPVPPAERIHLGGLQRAGDGTLIPEDQANSVPRPRTRRLKLHPALTANPPPVQPVPAPAPAEPAQSQRTRLSAAQAQDRRSSAAGQRCTKGAGRATAPGASGQPHRHRQLGILTTVTMIYTGALEIPGGAGARRQLRPPGVVLHRSGRNLLVWAGHKPWRRRRADDTALLGQLQPQR